MCTKHAEIMKECRERDLSPRGPLGLMTVHFNKRPFEKPSLMILARRFSKRVNCFRKTSSTLPVGPLRCFARLISAC